MITSVYLSNNIIRAVTGNGGRKITLQKEASQLMGEGNLINGVITNAAGLEAELKEFWSKHNLPRNNVYLVVNSSKFVTKQLSLPNVKRSKLMPVIPMEFADVERYEDAIYDYMQMPKSVQKSMQDILGVMVERSFVEEYVQLFEHMGIKLAGFSTAIGSAIKTLDYLPSMQKKNCIVQVVDGYNLESILWVDGKYVHSTSRRIFAEPGTEEFHTEVLRHTNSTMQFFDAMKLEQKINEVYIGGVKKEEIENLRQLAAEIELGIDIMAWDISSDVKGIGASESVADYLYAFGALVKNPNDINFLEAYKKGASVGTDSGLSVRKLMPIIVISAIGIVVTAVVGGIYIYRSNYLKELNDYLNDPINIQTAEKVDAYDKQTRTNNAAIMEADTTDDMISSYPLVNDKVRKTIEKAAGSNIISEITGYNAEEGALTLSAKAKTESAVNEYITRLYDTDLFENIEYTGYTYIEAESVYSINVTCYLAESAGK